MTTLNINKLKWWFIFDTVSLLIVSVDKLTYHRACFAKMADPCVPPCCRNKESTEKETLHKTTSQWTTNTM